jgi:hypothetical protein
MQKAYDFQLNMHLNIQGVCNKNEVVLNIVLAYVASKLKLDQNIANETELSFRLEKLGKNSAVPKNLARSVAGVSFLDLTSNLMSFFWLKGDMKMYLEVKFTKSSFKKASDSEFIRICGNLLTVANDNLAQLADRGITQQTLTANSALLENFVNERQIYVDTRRERFEVTAQLAKQIKATNFDLKSIDSIIDGLSASQPILASDYWKARELPKPIGSKIVFKGKVYDSVTNQPLSGAFVTITPAENSKSLTSGADLVKIVKIKSAGGGFQLKSVPNGNYLVTATYFGYTDYQVPAYVNDGALTIVELPLTKVA